jgi:hypothetical protein
MAQSTQELEIPELDEILEIDGVRAGPVLVELVVGERRLR